MRGNVSNKKLELPIGVRYQIRPGRKASLDVLKTPIKKPSLP